MCCAQKHTLFWLSASCISYGAKIICVDGLSLSRFPTPASSAAVAHSRLQLEMMMAKKSSRWKSSVCPLFRARVTAQHPEEAPAAGRRCRCLTMTRRTSCWTTVAWPPSRCCSAGATDNRAACVGISDHEKETNERKYPTPERRIHATNVAFRFI